MGLFISRFGCFKIFISYSRSSTVMYLKAIYYRECGYRVLKRECHAIRGVALFKFFINIGSGSQASHLGRYSYVLKFIISNMLQLAGLNFGVSNFPIMPIYYNNLSQIQSIMIPALPSTLLIILLLEMASSTNDKYFSKYQSMFKGQIYQPQQFQLPETTSVDRQQEQYQNNYQQRLYSPSLSNIFRLTKQRVHDSTFVLAQNQTTLHVQVIVSKQSDPQTKLIRSSKPISLYILQQNTKEIVLSYQVHEHRVIEVLLQDRKLYEILCILQSEQNSTYIDKVIRVDIQLTSNSLKSESVNRKWVKEYFHKISNLYDHSSTIFLDSLENWDVIHSSRAKYFTHHSNWKLYSIIQLFVLFVLILGELLYLRKLLHNDAVVLI